MREQATLARAFSFKGVGLHTGIEAKVDITPADVDCGLVFVLRGGVRVSALASNVVDTSRATVLGVEGVTVSTVEHLLSALYAFGISNAEIHVDGPEIPVMDGTAEQFVAFLRDVSVRTQGAPRATLRIDEPMVFSNGDRLLLVAPATDFRVRFVADFPAPVGTQFLDVWVEPETYADEIAGARTFGYLHEVEALLARGLARGGTLENALVFGPDGPLQALRWPNEVVRHKILDLIGDFALLGVWLEADILAVKSGHTLHARATAALRERVVLHDASMRSR